MGRIVADLKAYGLEPDGREVDFLAIAERLADRLAEIEAAVGAEVLYSRLSGGRIVAKPLVAEARMTSGALTRVLSGIGVDEAPRIPRSTCASKPPGEARANPSNFKHWIATSGVTSRPRQWAS